MAQDYQRAQLDGGPLAGDVILAPLRPRYGLPEWRIGVPVPRLDEAAETLSWDTAVYLLPSAQPFPPPRDRMWHYSYVSTVPGLPDE